MLLITFRPCLFISIRGRQEKNKQATYVFQLSSSTHGSGETPVWCLAGFRKAPNEKINCNAISRCSTVGDQPCLLSMEAKGRAVVRVIRHEHTHISQPLISYSWQQIKEAQQIQTEFNCIQIQTSYAKEKNKQEKPTKFKKTRNTSCVFSEQCLCSINSLLPQLLWLCNTK